MQDDLSDWICLHRGLQDSCREANHLVNLRRAARRPPDEPTPVNCLDLRQTPREWDPEDFITPPAPWEGQYE